MIFLWTLVVVLLLFSYRNHGFSHPTTFNVIKSDYLKAFFPYFIILHHISHRTGNHYLVDFEYVGPYVVGVFFFVSGYGLEFKFGKKQINWGNYIKRIVNLLVPVIMPLLLYGLIYFPRLESPIDFVTERLCRFILVLPYSWFVVVIFFIYSLYYLIRSLDVKWVVADIFLFLGLSAFAVLMYLGKQNGTLFVSNYAFLLGVIFRQKEEYFMKIGRITFFIVFTMFSFVSFSYIYGKPLFQGFALLGVVIYVFCLFLMIPVFEFKKNEVINKLKDISYEVYLCQGVAIILVDMLSIKNIVVLVVCVVIVDFVLAIFCKKITRIIFGKLLKTSFR